MDPALELVIPQLISAVETIMSPSVTPQQRLEAQQVCQNFKESSPLCASCGLILAKREQSHIVRHFGLQLVEHSIKHSWNDMCQEDKDSMKASSLELIAAGTDYILEEQSHIKDGVSRVVVEVVKRSWPQMWPSLLKDLTDLCQLGETQSEIVLSVLLRLVEDVVAFQNLPSQRRRDILLGLTSSMADLFSFFLNLLQQHTRKYTELKGSTEKECIIQAAAHCKVSQAVLSCLSGYVDWVNMSHILENNGLLLQMLCLLLSEEKLQVYAAECLLLIVSRKGQVEERKPLLILFSEDAMNTILNAAGSASSSLDEYYYLFLKKLCQVLTEIGKQLCAVWGSAEGVCRPPNFEKYLQSVLAFTLHPSQMLGSFTQSLWASFLRHEVISQDSVVLSFIPKLMETATITLLKVGFPSQINSPSCDFARQDFDSDEDFNAFFSKYRAEISETIRLSTRLEPSFTFGFAVQWLDVLLKKPVDAGTATESGNCNLSSPSFLEWDAMTVFLENMMTKLPSVTGDTSYMQEGIRLLKTVFVYQTQDPLILSSLLSCISALFVFLTSAPEILPSLLDKIFSLVVFNIPGQTKSTRSKAVKNVRRHACCVLVKICKQHPDLLLPAFDQLCTHISSISGDPDQLSQMEKCTLMEALILINNQYQNFEKQSRFIETIIKPVKTMWLSEEFKQAFWDPGKFMCYVGLDQPPVEPSSEDVSGINRSHITYCISTMLAVLKRSTWPDDSQVAQAGGFQVNTAGGSTVLRNPATDHIIQLMENLLILMRTLNALWNADNVKLRHPDFTKAYDLQDADKQAVLGIKPPCIDNTDLSANKGPLERMQNFFSNIHDCSCHILGNAGQCLGYEFYAVPGLAEMFLKTVFLGLDHIPDYRLRPIIRSFLKPLILHCPSEFHSTSIVPLLASLCPYMFQRLESKWQVINQRSENSADDDVNPESQEVLEDQLSRQLTREYIDLLATVFHCRRTGTTHSDDNVMDEDFTVTHQQSKDDCLSELGQLVMKQESVYPSVILCVYNGLKWNDSQVCNKCINLCWSLVKQLLSQGEVIQDLAVFLFTTVLQGLQLHGQHEGIQASLLTLGLQLYEALRPLYPPMNEVLKQIPNVKAEAIRSFDDKLLQTSPQKQLTDKKKKEAFKKLVTDIIGKNIGQHFKEDIHIKNLPTIFRATKKVKSVIEEVTNGEDAGICALFKPDDVKPTNGVKVL
ncbi:LOW QUALITY PROTEIN: exportin-5-like [Liolophura sinensis]|uniref:LOW QUALITY PROTEIN: exportin-5-like n=1 Tax=Liolophura sinensis TaxID=3198878 RepID=UPI003158B903